MGSCTESVLLLSDVAVDKNEGGLHFEKFSLNFVKVLVPIKAKPKMCHGLLFLQKIDRCLSPKFKGNFVGTSKCYKE